MKSMRKIMAVLGAAALVCVMSPERAVYAEESVAAVQSAAEDGKEAVQRMVTPEEIEKMGAWKAIQYALYEARDKATEQNPYIITVAPGSYELVGLLRLYSNTKLVLNGVTLYGDDGKNVLRLGELDKASEGVTGYCYKNIEVEGGVLDGGNHQNTVVKVAHASNVTMTGVTMQNVHNAHIMEVAGVDGFTVKDCTFRNQALDEDSTTLCYEMIQLDVLYWKHLSGCRAEDLAIKNVVIDGCTFSNAPRGVGSHTDIFNNPVDGVRITNCTFDNMKSIAIQGMGWINSTISGNTITNAPRGIAYYSVINSGQGTYLGEVLAKEGGTVSKTSITYKEPEKDQNIVICDNTITLNDAQDPFAGYERTAILVAGREIEKVVKYKDNSGNLPVGNYYVSGVELKNNTIRTTGQGIRIVDVRNAKITGNAITYVKTADAASNDYYGIQAMSGSTNAVIDKNTIQNTDSNGIYINKDASADSISYNTISKTGKYGIDVESVKVGLIIGNKISDTKDHGIFVYKNASVTTISKNTINRSGEYAIQISMGSTAKKVTNNTISNTVSNGIYINKDASVDSVSYNTISKTGKYGIDVESVKVGSIIGNKISNTKDRGIFVYKNASVTTISKNTISKTGTCAVQISTGSTAQKVTNNTIKSPGKFGILYSAQSKGKTVTGNKITGAKEKKISITKDSTVAKVSE